MGIKDSIRIWIFTNYLRAYLKLQHTTLVRNKQFLLLRTNIVEISFVSPQNQVI